MNTDSESKSDITQEKIESNKEQIKSLLTSTKRPGIDKLIKWIDEKTDFYTAPASAKYHLCCRGGLAQHSLNVFVLLKQKVDSGLISIRPESVAISALLHDLCKVNFYHLEKKNVKEGTKINAYGKEVANWVEKDAWVVHDAYPVGHGEKSCFYIQRFMQLTEEEYAMIRLHMGPDKNTYPDPFAATAEIYPGVAAIHTADLEAAFIMEARV